MLIVWSTEAWPLLAKLFLASRGACLTNRALRREKTTHTCPQTAGRLLPLLFSLILSSFLPSSSSLNLHAITILLINTYTSI